MNEKEQSGSRFLSKKTIIGDMRRADDLTKTLPLMTIMKQRRGDATLKRKRQEITNGKKKITSHVFPIDTNINGANAEKTNRAACKKIANQPHINDKVITRDEAIYSDQRDTPRFVKPPVAIDDWKMIVNKRKSNNNRAVKHCFKCFLPGHYKIQCANIIKYFKCGRSGHTQYKCRETKQNAPHCVAKKYNKHSEMANNLFYDERPEIITVYFERRGHLNKHTQFLHHSGLITFCNGAPLPERRG
jgi:hypothetical protein